MRADQRARASIQRLASSEPTPRAHRAPGRARSSPCQRGECAPGPAAVRSIRCALPCSRRHWTSWPSVRLMTWAERLCHLAQRGPPSSGSAAGVQPAWLRLRATGGRRCSKSSPSTSSPSTTTPRMSRCAHRSARLERARSGRCPTASTMLCDGLSSTTAPAARPTPSARSPPKLPDARQRGLAAELLRGMRELAGRHQLRRLIAPVRPSWEERYPLTRIERYIPPGAARTANCSTPGCACTNASAASVATALPRTRSHHPHRPRLGDVHRLALPESATYVFPHGLAPLTRSPRRRPGHFILGSPTSGCIPPGNSVDAQSGAAPPRCFHLAEAFVRGRPVDAMSSRCATGRCGIRRATSATVHPLAATMVAIKARSPPIRVGRQAGRGRARRGRRRSPRAGARGAPRRSSATPGRP